MFGFIRLHRFFLKLFRSLHILYVVSGYYSINWLNGNRLLRFFIPKRYKNMGVVLSREERLRMMLERLGPTFVKFGQIIADRPDLVSDKLRKELRKLQNKAMPFDHDLAMSMIEAELSTPMDSVFRSFEAECIGAASMGQVYKAVLMNGETVVVKIQRPNVSEKIHLDLQILEFLARKIANEFPELIVLDPEGIVKEFGETLRKELNYFNEAANARRFGEMFRDYPLCKIPKVYEQYSTSKLLVMEYIQGIPPFSKRKLKERGLDPKAVANNGMEIFLKMIFEHGFFHADPHCGNIFVMENNRIGLIDFGMVGALKPKQMEFLAKFVRALVQRNASLLCDSILLLNTSSRFRDRDDLEFDLDQMLQNYKGTSYQNMKVAHIMDDCFRIIRKYGIQIPSGIFLLIKSIATIEKVGLHLDPQISIAEKIHPYAVALIRKQYSPVKLAGELINSLRKYVELGKDLPENVSDILYNMKTGKLTHDIRFNNQDALSNTMKNTGKTIALSILISFSVFGCSMIIAKGHAGYFVKSMFAVTLIFTMFTIVRLLRRSGA